MDLRAYFQTMSAMGKFAMAEKRANSETMHFAPFRFKKWFSTDGRKAEDF
jgi:hypothetical protein